MYSIWYHKVFRGSVTVYKEILCQSVDTAKRANGKELLQDNLVFIN